MAEGEAYRKYVVGEGWQTVAIPSGGGGSLPDWWTVDSTPGSESVEFDGVVTISPTAFSDNGLTIKDEDGNALATIGNSSGAGVAFAIYGREDQTAAILWIDDFDGNDLFRINADGSMGFFGKSPAAQPAAPTTLGDVIAALKALGLVAT